MQLRPYQEDAKKAIFLNLAVSHSTLLELPTGCGKTTVFSFVAHEWPGRVLVIAHRDELIRQAASEIQLVTGDPVAVEMGRERAGDQLYGTKVTVASVQTLMRSNRRARFHPDHFSLIIVDEGHHATAVSYQEVVNYFASAKRLLVTATPLRADNVRLEDVCDTVAFQYGIEQAIEDGWLVPVQQRVVKVEGLDFTKVRTVAQDFNQGDLEKILTEEEPLHRMVASAYEIVGNRQSLWFCVSVKQAHDLAAVLKRYASEENVRFLCGETPIDERREAVDSYRKGNIQHLLNCGIFLEGFNAPSASAIVMARPTKSLGLYMQMLGRGTRPLPNTVDGVEHAEGRRQAISFSDKPDLLVIDYCGNAGKHKIVQAADVLGGKYPAPVRDYAKQTALDEAEEQSVEAKALKSVAIDTALSRAKAELELIEEQQSIRKKVRADAVAFQTQEVSLFVRQYTGKPVSGSQKEAGELCSDKQAGYICFLSRKSGKSWTFKQAKELTGKQARGVIGKLQKEAGMA